MSNVHFHIENSFLGFNNVSVFIPDEDVNVATNAGNSSYNFIQTGTGSQSNINVVATTISSISVNNTSNTYTFALNVGGVSQNITISAFSFSTSNSGNGGNGGGNLPLVQPNSNIFTFLGSCILPSSANQVKYGSGALSVANGVLYGKCNDYNPYNSNEYQDGVYQILLPQLTGAPSFTGNNAPLPGNVGAAVMLANTSRPLHEAPTAPAFFTLAVAPTAGNLTANLAGGANTITITGVVDGNLLPNTTYALFLQKPQALCNVTTNSSNTQLIVTQIYSGALTPGLSYVVAGVGLVANTQTTIPANGGGIGVYTLTIPATTTTIENVTFTQVSTSNLVAGTLITTGAGSVNATGVTYTLMDASNTVQVTTNASVSGITVHYGVISAALASNWAGNNGLWTMGFSSGESWKVQLTNGSNVATFLGLKGALAGGLAKNSANNTANVYQYNFTYPFLNQNNPFAVPGIPTDRITGSVFYSGNLYISGASYYDGSCNQMAGFILQAPANVSDGTWNCGWSNVNYASGNTPQFSRRYGASMGLVPASWQSQLGGPCYVSTSLGAISIDGCDIPQGFMFSTFDPTKETWNPSPGQVANGGWVNPVTNTMNVTTCLDYFFQGLPTQTYPQQLAGRVLTGPFPLSMNLATNSNTQYAVTYTLTSVPTIGAQTATLTTPFADPYFPTEAGSAYYMLTFSSGEKRIAHLGNSNTSIPGGILGSTPSVFCNAVPYTSNCFTLTPAPLTLACPNASVIVQPMGDAFVSSYNAGAGCPIFVPGSRTLLFLHISEFGPNAPRADQCNPGASSSNELPINPPDTQYYVRWQVAAYDMLQAIQVKQGIQASYIPTPYAIWPFPGEQALHTAIGCLSAGDAGWVAIDSVTNIMYVVLGNFLYNTGTPSTIVYAWQINPASNTNTNPIEPPPLALPPLVITSNAAVSQAVKWNPGHYAGTNSFVQSSGIGKTSNGAIKLSELTQLCPVGNPNAFPNIIGYRMYITWGAIQQNKGVFDWSSIDNTLAFLAANGKHLVVTMMGGPFSGGQDMPQYVTSNSSMGPSSAGGSKFGFWGTQPAIYRANVFAEYSNAYAQMLQRYNGNTYFEGVMHQEDSFFVSQLQGAPDWDNTGTTFFKTSKNLISVCMNSAPNTTVAYQGTFQASSPAFSDNLEFFMYDVRCIPAETDTYGFTDPARPSNNLSASGWSWGPQTYMGGIPHQANATAMDLRPLTRFWNDVEAADLGAAYINSSNNYQCFADNGTGYTAADILKSINTNYKGSHAFWGMLGAGDHVGWHGLPNTSGGPGSNPYANNVWGTPGSGNLADAINNAANNLTTVAYPQNYIGNSQVPWTFAQAFEQTHVPVGFHITATNTNSFQADVRNLWPDGSVKIAVLSGVSTLNVATPTTIQLGTANGAASGGANVAEPVSLPNVFVNMNVATVGSFSISSNGKYTLNSLLGVAQGAWSANTSGRVRSFPGPVMSEFHYYQQTSDPYVSLWWYVRAYSTGDVEVQVRGENCWWGHAVGRTAPSEKDYSYSVFISNGTTPDFSANNYTHFARTRWEYVGWATGIEFFTTPAHHPTYLCDESLLIPRFAYRGPTSNSFNGISTAGVPWVANINPISQSSNGNYTMPMNTTSYQASVGLLPQWETIYCTAPTPDSSGIKAQAYTATIGNMRLAGQYPVFIRDESTGRPINPLTYPTAGLDVPAANGFGFSGIQGNNNISNTGATFPAATPLGGSVGYWDVAHHPSLGYVPYLIEGRWSYLEDLQMSASFALMSTSPEQRTFGNTGTQTLQLVLPSWTPPLTTSGAGWAIRTMAQAATIMPRYIMGSNTAVPAVDATLANVWTQSIHDTAYFIDHAFQVGDLQIQATSNVLWNVCTGGSSGFYNTIGYIGMYDNLEPGVDDPQSTGNGGNGVYNVNYNYSLNDYTMSNGYLYFSTTANNLGMPPSGNNLSDANGVWQYVWGPWNNTNQYNLGQLSIFNGLLYQSIAANDSGGANNVNTAPSGNQQTNWFWNYVGIIDPAITDIPNDAWWGNYGDSTISSLALGHATELAIEGLSNQAELANVAKFAYQGTIQMMGSDGSTGAIKTGGNYRYGAAAGMPMLTYPLANVAPLSPFNDPPLPLLLPIERTTIYMNHFALPVLSNTPGQYLCTRYGSTPVQPVNDVASVATGDWARQISVLGLGLNANANSANGAWDTIMRSNSVSSAYASGLIGDIAGICFPNPSDIPMWLLWPRTNGVNANTLSLPP